MAQAMSTMLTGSGTGVDVATTFEDKIEKEKEYYQSLL